MQFGGQPLPSFPMESVGKPTMRRVVRLILQIFVGGVPCQIAAQPKDDSAIPEEFRKAQQEAKQRPGLGEPLGPLDGPSLEKEVEEGISTSFLWLIPISEKEVIYKKVHGLEAIEARFEATGFNYLDPESPSVV